MELTYPINLIGHDEGNTVGEVVTRHGEYLGKWTFTEGAEKISGAFYFIVDGDAEPLFSESVPFLSSGMLTGLAMSRICRSIRVWHEEKDQA